LNVVDARGAVLRPAPYKVAGRDLQWTVAKDDFGYELRVE
jgi:hypothetical protein